MPETTASAIIRDVQASPEPETQSQSPSLLEGPRRLPARLVWSDTPDTDEHNPVTIAGMRRLLSTQHLEDKR
jgi:hypothetical protein